MNELIAGFEGLGPVMAGFGGHVVHMGDDGRRCSVVFPQDHEPPFVRRNVGLHRRGDGRSEFGPCWRLPLRWLGERVCQSGASRHRICARRPLHLWPRQVDTTSAHQFQERRSGGPKTDWHRTTLLVLAITLHNIPEGLAVGVLFGGAALGLDGATTPAPWPWPSALAFKTFQRACP